MEMLLGARPYDFVDEATKRNIVGVSVFIADSDVDGAVGYVSDKISMSNEDFKAVFGTLAEFEKIVTKPVVISYNKRGKPVAYEFITQK
ncbi:hypothetical protein LJC32_02160 [Oscillospiraceae bacterium OttesenSCG-928-F05]|nr:hypothetical protein [Oscillospiraceae bacterium OttesenSCG-928-F05]